MPKLELPVEVDVHFFAVISEARAVEYQASILVNDPDDLEDIKSKLLEREDAWDEIEEHDYLRIKADIDIHEVGVSP